MDIMSEYDKLLNDQIGGNFYERMDNSSDDDVETFVTSKEIIEEKQKLDEAGIRKNLPFGIEPPDVEEEVHFKRYTKKRVHKYTESEMNQIRAQAQNVIVHDYGEYDIYHMSDEERAKNDMLAELSLKLSGVKRVYRKVDQYIEAMRIVVEAWELLEKNNYIHTKDEFFELVRDGIIVSSRIVMPKLKKIEQYNMDSIILYISNPELDPKDLLPAKQTKTYDDWYDDEDDDENEEDMIERLLSPEEVQYILAHKLDPEIMVTPELKPKYIRDYDSRNLLSSRKKKNKRSKKDKAIIQDAHDILNKIQNNHASDYSRSYMAINSMFQVPEKKKDMWDDLYYTGSWTNDDEMFLYDIITEEERMRQKAPNETYRTYGDIELTKFFQTMEANGFSTLELRRKMEETDEDSKRKESDSVKKENKKIESAIIQRITKLNNNPEFKKLIAKAEKAVNKMDE